MYSAKELDSGREKCRSYRLVEKHLYGGIEGPEESGEKLYPRREVGLIQSVE